MEKQTSLDGWKKFLTAAAGAYGAPFVVPPEFADQSVWIIIAYIVMQAAVDAVKVLSARETTDA